MARGCSVFTLYALNLVLFLLGALILAAPLVAAWQCAGVCHVSAGEIESLRFVKVLEVVGGGLVVFALFGCCLAASGKKRYRCPYLAVLLALVLGGGLVVALDQGLLYAKLATFDPAAPQKVQSAIDGLTTSGMQTFYHDFASVFRAADCAVEPAGPDEHHVTCRDCAPLETAFSTCTENWVASPQGDEYLKQCKAQFTTPEPSCGDECTLAFCQCAGTLGETVEHYTAYVKDALLAVGGLLFFLLVASICVARKQDAAPLQTRELGQVLIVEPRRQPVLA